MRKIIWMRLVIKYDGGDSDEDIDTRGEMEKIGKRDNQMKRGKGQRGLGRNSDFRNGGRVESIENV